MKQVEQAMSANLFATPILSHYWNDSEGMNAQLRDSILDHERLNPGARQTNIGGWHSAPGLLEFCGIAGKRMIGLIHAMVEEATRRLYSEFGQPQQPVNWILSAWANVNRHGDLNHMHTHPGATWSGVYYVDGGRARGDTEDTVIRLSDPNPARTNLFFPELSASDVTFKPQPGLMILFPSYVPHTVLPHQGDRPRISVGFNVRRDPFP